VIFSEFHEFSILGVKSAKSKKTRKNVVFGSKMVKKRPWGPPKRGSLDASRGSALPISKQNAKNTQKNAKKPVFAS